MRTGRLGTRELIHALRILGLAEETEWAVRALQKYDDDRRGALTRAQFEALVRGQIERSGSGGVGLGTGKGGSASVKALQAVAGVTRRREDSARELGHDERRERSPPGERRWPGEEARTERTLRGRQRGNWHADEDAISCIINAGAGGYQERTASGRARHGSPHAPGAAVLQ